MMPKDIFMDKRLSFKSHKTLYLLIFLLQVHAMVLFGQNHNLYFDNYTIDNGLSNNYVHSIVQDSKGWVWVGTNQGLNRFDGYKFTSFSNHPNDSTSLGGGIVRAFFEDNKGTLWIGSDHGGLNKFNRDKENFSHVSASLQGFSLKDKSVNVIKQDKFGMLWIGTTAGLCQYDLSGKIVRVFTHNNLKNSLANDYIHDLFIDSTGVIWIGTAKGLDLLNPELGTFKHVGLSKVVDKIEVEVIFRANDRKIWVGTNKNSIFVIDPLSMESQQMVIDPLNDRSVAVRDIVCSRTGKYWIGTRGGLYVFDPKSSKFEVYKHDEREEGSICHNSIFDLYVDSKGDCWIGTRGGVSYANSEKQVFRHYKALPYDNSYLNDNELYAFCMDSKGKLWIGTENGGVNILDPKTGKFTYLVYHKTKPNSLSDNCVKALMVDGYDNVWVGMFNGGINVVNSRTGQIKKFINNPSNSGSLLSNMVWALYFDNERNIWVGTDRGLDLFVPQTQTFKHVISTKSSVVWIKEDSNHDLWISTNSELIIYNPNSKHVKHYNVFARMMHEDNKGQFWLTTINKGLILFDKGKGILKVYDQQKGIANNQSYCILEDNFGFFWISTIKGLSKFDPQKETFENFNKLDGLQNNQFQYGACLKTPKGELVFGGINGLNIFDPAEIRNDKFDPPIVLTELKIFNKPITISNERNAILQNSISEVSLLKIPYNQNVITLEFAALNYSNPLKNKYAYKLEGFDKEWNEVGAQHSVTYTNLNPGEYSFLVKASNNNFNWSKRELKLQLVILPPFWKTLWFYVLLAVVIIVLLYSLYRFFANRNHLKHELVFERERAQKLHELDMMKVHFFTNVSHEIRTPLTLITSPLDKMLQTEMSLTEIKALHLIMNRNAKHLLRLINQLLDFRKIESGNAKLELSRGDMVVFVREAVLSFSQMAEEKKIKLKFLSNEHELYTFFDEDKIEKIINNLLSNSLKFTPENGIVSVTFSVESEFSDTINHGYENEKFIKIVVKDTGIGITESNLDKIFNRFFQVDADIRQTGTGIGLALTRELVKLHKGHVFVESVPGQGSKFTIQLPLDLKNEERSSFAGSFQDDNSTSLASNLDPSLEKNITDKILLVVDDNADVRFFIKSHFESEFLILEASNGKEALAMVFKFIPDIIISDVMMPVMNGTELCKSVKRDIRSSHIPVILLTALSSKDNKMEGVMLGADDYITKPFDIILLKTKVENLLLLRNMLREKYSGEMVLKPSNIIVNKPNEKFLNKTIEIIEANIIDPDFDIDKLSVAVGVSRTQLYRKLSALTEMTVHEFIRNIRLKRAAQLLEQNKMTVSEVTFAVGFKDLSHFRKCFRQEFGMSATEYALRKATDNPN